jgi:NAD+ diphosphatase
MPITFDDHPEVGSTIGFGQNRLESASEARDQTTLATALADSRARFHLFADGKILVRKDDDPTASFCAADRHSFGGRDDALILLGHDDGVPVLATTIPTQTDTLPEPYQLYDMRSLLYSSSVTDSEASAAARACSLLHWHSMNRYCGRCGAQSQSRLGGYRRDCDQCGSKIFPRTDPVVIMLATDGNRCLLGRGAHFPPGWYSTLAGFVEPGETIEAAVRRETMEESGIEIARVRYYASQPWPFPHSLMIGAYGEAVSSQISFDANELEDCRWFTRADIVAMIEDNHPNGFRCPPTKAIAHALIRNWVSCQADMESVVPR